MHGHSRKTHRVWLSGLYYWGIRGSRVEIIAGTGLLAILLTVKHPVREHPISRRAQAGSLQGKYELFRGIFSAGTIN
jgi:hypothetical protein